MRVSKRYLAAFVILLFILYFLAAYRLPYYIYKPGTADALDPIVKVEGGYPSKGSLHMVTVSGGQATPISYAIAKVAPHEEILPIEQVRPEGISDEEYMHAQLEMMDSSQEAAKVVAYRAAKEDVKIENKGVYVVTVVEGMPAEGKLKAGDRIIQIDNQKMNNAEDLTSYIQSRKAGDTLNIRFFRGKKEKNEKIRLEPFKDSKGKAGIGIQLVTDRKVKVHPEVHFSSGDIGGPSAGLMFSLEIYDQLTKEDLTKGYQIAGTGEIDYSGNVLPIGGIDKKVIAANKEGCEIFFAPNERGKKGSNYEVAKATAQEIGTDMKIVPVDSFDEALQYLNHISQK